MKLIGLAGTNGSGKDTVGHMLAERHNYLFVSVTDMLRQELTEQNLPLDREHMRNYSSNLRRESGYGVLIDNAVAYFKAQNKNYEGLVIASLRHPGEAMRVHELGGKVIWVDAESRIRYDRVQLSSPERGSKRAVDDNKTFEQFLAEEQAEMQYSGDAATLNMSAVKDLADIFLENNGSDVKVFKAKAEKAVCYTKAT